MNLKNEIENRNDLYFKNIALHGIFGAKKTKGG